MSGMFPDDQESYHLAGLAGLYALDALEGDELVRFEALLATNEELRDEVAEFRATAARLADVSASTPPPNLRANVLAQVATTRQDPPVVRSDDRRNARYLRRALLSVAAAVLLVVAGLGGYVIADRNNEPSQLATALANTDTRVVPLTGAGTDDAAGHVVVSPGTGKVIIVSNQMPPAAPGRTYELWKIDEDGGVHNAGLFEPDRSGKVEAALEVDLDGATGFAITDEPEGGSPQATTPVLMEATLV